MNCSAVFSGCMGRLTSGSAANRKLRSKWPVVGNQRGQIFWHDAECFEQIYELKHNPRGSQTFNDILPPSIWKRSVGLPFTAVPAGPEGSMATHSNVFTP